MNQSQEEAASTEIRNLLATLNDSNYNSVVHDLSQYFDNGTEESMLVIAICLDHFNIYEDNLESAIIHPAIASLFRNLMQKPHFAITFFGLMRNRQISEEFLNNLSTSMKLAASEKVGFGLALLDSENNDVRLAGRNFCASQCKALCDTDDTIDTVVADVQDVLRFLEQSEVLAKHVDSFKLMILEVWLNANCRFILADKAPDTKLLSHTDFHVVDPTEMSKETCASPFIKMLGAWNQLSYHCGGLRVEGFQLRSDVAFSLLMSCYRNTCQAPFPLAAVCGNVWENTGSQLLFLKHAISSPPEVFTFAHCKRKPEYVDHKFQNDHACQPWLCLDLLEVLCQLAEKGCATSVWPLMEFPLINCPEVLLLGMAHIITPQSFLQIEVSKSVLPMLLKDTSKRGIIHHLWCINPLLLSRALNDSLGLDLEILDKVVDLFQELKILSSILDLVPASLGIKLAAIASTKKFIDLVEWLTTNLSTSEDIFKECYTFLNEVEENSGEVWNIYKETAPTFSKALQLHAKFLDLNQLPKQMESLYVRCMEDSPKMDSIEDPSSSTSEPYADHTKTKNSSSPFTASTSAKVSMIPTMFDCRKSVDTLLAALGNREIPIEIPPSETQDQILFLMSNLSAAAIEEKAKEFTAILAEQYHPWFAQYLVTKRAALEPNYHTLYIDFFEKTKSRQLNEEIVQASYESCKVLLKSNLIRSSMEVRKLLKNLGIWLGKLTIGRNKPLLAKHIDPKSLIIEAYEKGLMIGVIPFISKILELCQSSLTYQLPNPWTMAILGLLVEIHEMPHLKASLTFEIEVLFKNLKLDMKEVTPTSLLKDKARTTEGNPDFSQTTTIKEVECTVTCAVNRVEPPAEPAGPSYQGGTSDIVNQPPLPASIIPRVQFFDLDNHLHRMLPMAMNTAIEKLVSTIVQRAVSIATQTTIQLALKDYLHESDEDIHNASSIMVVSLAGNLSYATCKAPLRNLMSTHLRNSVKGLNIASEFIEDAVKRVVDKNLHLGCASIEKEATEKGLMMVKRELTRELSIRKKQKESSESSISETTEPSLTTSECSTSFISKTIEPSYTTNVAVDKIQVLLKKLEAFIANDAKEAKTQSVVSEVRAVMLKCTHKDEAALAMAQNVFESLYRNASNNTAMESHLIILAVIWEVSKLVGKELTGWVLNSSDDKRFNIPITVALIRRRLLNLVEYGFYMARLINAGKIGNAIDFAISLVKTLETSDPWVIPELCDVTDALAKVTSSTRVARNDDTFALQSSEPDFLRGQVDTFLAEWFRIRTHPGVAVYADYVQKVHQTVFSKSDAMPNRFFYYLLELVVSHFRASAINSNPRQFHQQEDAASFLAIEIYSDLVFSILKFYPDDYKLNRLSVLAKMLSAVVGFITNDADEMKAAFNPKPYFHLFISFFNRIHILNSVIDDAEFLVLTAISFAFHVLRPVKVPQFSFAWMDLVSHKDFMPKLLNRDNQEGWPNFYCLLIDWLQFMEPFLRSGELADPVKTLYSGTVNVLLALSHFFPGFVQCHGFNLCKAIPAHRLELQNIILIPFADKGIPRHEQPQPEGQSADLDKSYVMQSPQP